MNSLSASPLLSPLTGRKSRSDSGTQTEDNHMKTKDELIERINQLTHQQSCLVLQCQSMLLQLEEKDNELSSLKNTPTRAKEVAVQTEELPDTNEEPCQRCVILNEEARNMIQTIRTLEEEHVRLQNTWQEHNETEYSRAVDNMFNSDNNSTQLQSPFPLMVSMFHRHHDPWNSYINKEVRGINMELRESLEEVGAAMVDVSLLGRHLFTQHGQHLNRRGKLVLSDMIAVAARRLRLATARHPRTVVGLRPGLASRTSSSAKSQMHERLRTPLPTNCLQHESYAGAVI
ncbi:hypothetical protein J6590_037529 [Homalodisca vitripennis]|nr:hypothetical protein J6590_037529 [Homalodisca vitripennis]